MTQPNLLLHRQTEGDPTDRQNGGPNTLFFYKWHNDYRKLAKLVFFLINATSLISSCRLDETGYQNVGFYLGDTTLFYYRAFKRSRLTLGVTTEREGMEV